MPTGKVRFYDGEKGFGFITDDDGSDVFVGAKALPEGVTTLARGARVEYSVVETRKGVSAMSMQLLEPAPSVTTNRRLRDRKPAEEMVSIVEDVIKLLDGVESQLRRGHYPDRAQGAKVAQLLRAIAADLEA